MGQGRDMKNKLEAGPGQGRDNRANFRQYPGKIPVRRDPGGKAWFQSMSYHPRGRCICFWDEMTFQKR